MSVQLSPASVLTNKPPAAFSIIAYTLSVLEGATATPTIPQTPLGKPFLPESGTHVSPPSVLLYNPLPEPPLSMLCGRRITSHIPAYKTLGFPGSITKSEHPVCSFTNRVFVQVFPPSVVLNTPRSADGPNRCPITATQTVCGSLGCTRMRTICRPSFNPRFFQLFPASSLRHMPPNPSETFPRMVFSPSPTYTTLSSEGANATEPMVLPKYLSEMFFQLLPPSIVFQTPPPVAPK